MTQPMREIGNTSPFLPFGEAPQGGIDIPRRQAELNAHGFGMAAALSRGVGEMLRGGIVEVTTKPIDRAGGQVRYSTAATTDGYAGGWREFTHEGRTKLISVTLVQPDETGRTIEGSAEVKIAEPRMMGQTKLPTNERSVLVRIDNQGAPHVTGSRSAVKFSVDHPNPRSMHADLEVADKMFSEAAAGLTAIAGGMPLNLPELPPAQ